jgi:rRNA processing protein Gar1
MHNMARRERFILIEESKSEEEVLPSVRLEQEPVPLSPELTPELTQEPSVAPEAEIPAEVVTTAFSTVISGLIVREWESIDSINSAIATFTIEKPENTAVVEILKQIIDEKTAHVGMLNKVLGEVDEKTAELVKDGEEKAETIIEPEKETEEKKDELKEDFDELNQIRDKFTDFYDKLFVGAIDRVYEELEENGNLGRFGINENEVEILKSLNKDQLATMIKDLGDNFSMPDHVWEAIDEQVEEDFGNYLSSNAEKLLGEPVDLTGERPDELDDKKEESKK